MAKSLKISIRFKILSVLGAVLCSAVGLYLYLASEIFYQDKTLLVYELSQASVRTLGDEVDVYLSRITDKMKLLSYSLSKDSFSADPLSNFLLAQTEGVLRIGVISKSDEGSPETKVFHDWAKPDTAGVLSPYRLDEVRGAFPIPFDEVIRNGIWIKNVSMPGPSHAETLPLMTIAIRSPAANQVIYADINLEYLLKAIENTGIAKAFLTDSSGGIIADSDSKNVLSRASFADHPLIRRAGTPNLKQEVKQFDYLGKKYLGSFYRLSTAGLIAVSQVETDEAFAAAQVLMRKSFLYALIVVTAAILISIFLAHSITAPIEDMVHATQLVAHGDFTVKVPITTRDEIAVLSKSFNSMTHDLGETLDQLKATQNQLIQSERMAAIGQIARSIGHEFGNILLAIVGNVDLAQATEDPAKIKKNLETILRASERASLIVRNLQSFSKNESVRASAEPPAMIRATLGLLQHEIKKNSIKVVDQCEACSPVLANAAEIEQVLMNLIINAMHAMPQGGTVSVGCRNEEGGNVVLWVKDTGSGIPPDVLPRIFDYAFTTKGEKGSGLGLAISKQIIDSHSGTITVKTELGSGTAFEIKLPRIEA
ncbi:MAG: sensor histidine kinase [Bdellovibrionota bacterium]